MLNKTNILVIFLLITIGCYSLPPSEMSCEALGKEIKGMKLQNMLGMEWEIMAVGDTVEISRTDDELVCEADAMTELGRSTLEISYFMMDGEGYFEVEEVFDFDDMYEGLDDIFDGIDLGW